MIDRKNYTDVIRYLDFLSEARGVEPMTRDAVRSRLRKLLEWADDRPLEKAPTFLPTFPKWLEKQRTVKGDLFMTAGLAGIFKSVQGFFTWARSAHPTRYRLIPLYWIEGLKPSRARRESATWKVREIYTLEDVRALLAVKPESLLQRRAQASVAMLYLSGMRLWAYVTLPIKAVDLEKWSICQFPSLGVKTKNRKAALTYLLPISDIRQVVQEWDQYLRANLSDEEYWYPTIEGFGNDKLTHSQLSSDRKWCMRTFNRELRYLCHKAGVIYHSPHKLRHGFAVYAIKQAKDLQDLKGISQNMMHSSLSITDGLYGNLAQEDLQNTIMGLAEQKAKTLPAAPGDMSGELLAEFLRILQSNPGALMAALNQTKK